MNATRFGLYTGIACTLPVVIWLLAQNPPLLTGPEWQATAMLANKALYIVVAIAIALFIPWHARHLSWSENFTAALILIFVTLPFMVIIWLSDAVNIEELLRGLMTLAVFSLIVLCLAKCIEFFKFTDDIKAYLRAVLQLVLATFVWTFSDHWLYWVVL